MCDCCVGGVGMCVLCGRCEGVCYVEGMRMCVESVSVEGCCMEGVNVYEVVCCVEGVRTWV